MCGIVKILTIRQAAAAMAWVDRVDDMLTKING